MKTFKLETQFGTIEEVFLKQNTYTKNGALTIQMFCTEDGEPWSTLTINLESFPTNGNKAFVDTNNNGISILNFIINNGLGKLTGRIGNSGYCSYPEMEFFLDKI